MKQYIGIALDHSGSIASYGLQKGCMRDYNSLIAATKKAASENNLDTNVSVVSFGKGTGTVRREVTNSNVTQLEPITYYSSEGQTPMLDAIGDLIDQFERMPDASNAAFLIMVITDGEENASRKMSWDSFRREVKLLQATDRWTFTFRVPKGYAEDLVNQGIPAGNILEWEQTEKALERSSQITARTLGVYGQSVSRGITATKSFYSDMSQVGTNDVVGTMQDISGDVRIFPVKDRAQIQSFVEAKTKQPYKKGAAFYQLMKPEKAVQDYKMIVVRNKNTGSVYSGKSARDLLNLPTTRTIKLIPKDHGDWDIFIQSTSTNRILPAGTFCLYWEQ